MALAAKLDNYAAWLDSYGKAAWIGAMVLAFIVFWPLGLALLAYMIWSGRMGMWKHGCRGRWHNERRHDGRHDGRRGTSGNLAFDEYRQETLRRLEEEEKEFHDFLDRLRQAKDKAEFDQFMSDRRRPRDAEPEANPGLA